MKSEYTEGVETAQETAEVAETLPEVTAEAAVESAPPVRTPDFDAFVERYPHVKGEEIPRQVWDRVEQGESLSLAWAEHENRMLKAQLERYKNWEDTRRRTPGSLGNQGREPDELERAWGED